MTINSRKFWEHIGEFVDINADTLNGTYQIIANEEDGLTLYDYKNQKVVENAEVQDGDYTLIFVDTHLKLELFYEASMKIVFGLMNNGWVLPSTLNPEPLLDLTDWVEKVKVVQDMLGVEGGFRD